MLRVFFKLTFTAVLFTAALLSACSDTPNLSRLPADAVILSFGDSLTHGTGADAEQSYPSILQKLTGKTVVRAGVPGELSAEGLKRLPAALEKTQPDLLILCHGGNDFLKKRNPASTRQNIIRMIEIARAHGVPTILLGVPRPGLFLSTADMYIDIAKEMNIPLEDSIIADTLSDQSLKSDPIHPNAKGYRQIAQAIHKLLIQTQALAVD